MKMSLFANKLWNSAQKLNLLAAFLIVPTLAQATENCHEVEARIETTHLLKKIGLKNNFTNFKSDQFDFNEFTCAWNTGKYLQHPDLGRVYEGLPKGAVELLDQRTATTRTFRTAEDLYSFQNVSADMHYFDENGFWVSADYNLQPTAGGWEAAKQANPIFISKKGEITQEIANHSLRLFQNIWIDGKKANMAELENAGSEGLIFANAAPNLDRVISLSPDLISSDYILRDKVSNNNELFYTISESIQLPKGYTISEGSGYSKDGMWFGSLLIKNNEGGVVSTIQQTIGTDSKADLNMRMYEATHAGYIVKALGNDQYLINMLWDKAWINSDKRTFPILLDPTYTSGAIGGGGATCRASVTYLPPTTDEISAPSEWQANTAQVNVPGGMNITSYSVTFKHEATSPGYINDIYTIGRFTQAGCNGASACATSVRFPSSGFNWENTAAAGTSAAFTPTLPSPSSTCTKSGCGVATTFILHATRVAAGLGAGTCNTSNHRVVSFVLTVNANFQPATVVTINEASASHCGNFTKTISGTVTNLTDYANPTITFPGAGVSGLSIIPNFSGAGSATYTANVNPPSALACTTLTTDYKPSVTNGTSGAGGCSSISPSGTFVETWYPIFTVNTSMVTTTYPTAAKAELIGQDGSVCQTVTNSNPCASAPYNFAVNTGSACAQTFSGTLVVNDAVAPVLANVPANISIPCGTPLPSLPTNVTATDNAPGTPNMNFTQTDNRNDCGTGTVIRSWSAVDCNGNSVAGNQTITVTYPTGTPLITGVPANITINASDPLPSTTGVSASIYCGAAPDISFVQQHSAPTCSTKQVLRTWKLYNCAGSLVDTKTQTITINL